MMCWAMAADCASGGVNTLLRSGASVSTTAITLAGSHRR